MTNRPTIFLDIDGVLADFVGGVCQLYGRNRSDVIQAMEPGNWDGLPDALGTTEDEMWRRIDSAGSDFWAGLPLLPWARTLAKECEAIADVYLATTPSRYPGSLSGKLRWIKAFGTHERRYVMTPHKHLLAGPKRLLIDDKDRNVKEFWDAGGQAVLFPSKWNSVHELAGDPLQYVLNHLCTIAVGWRYPRHEQ